MSEHSDADRAGGKKILIGLILIGFGIWMFIDPDMMDGESINNARKAFYKTILLYVWGIPGGILGVLVGLVLVFKGASQMDFDDE